MAKDISCIRAAEIFVDNTDLKGFPDGSTIDINGYLWNAEWNGGQVVNYDLNGRLINTIKTPMKRPTCCVFGGKNMNILYITSALEAGDIEGNVSGKTIAINTDTVGTYSNRFIDSQLK